MDSVNKVFLIGRTGQEAQLSYSKDGKAISKFSLATTRGWNDAKGERVEELTWHRITIFGKRAENVSKWIYKGTYLRVEGYIKNGKFTNKDGIDVYTSDVICEDIGFLGTKDENEKLAKQSQRSESRQNNQSRNQTKQIEEPNNQNQQPESPDSEFSNGSEDGFGSDSGSDDIPF